MIKFKILSIGKTKEPWLEEALTEYQKRLKSQAIFEFHWAKDDAQLIELAKKESSFISLDPHGTLFNSDDFAVFLRKQWENHGSRLTFIIGGAQGLPAILKTKEMISLSALTFTHQLTRLVLVEQIYRAFEIIKGSAYHK